MFYCLIILAFGCSYNILISLFNKNIFVFVKIKLWYRVSLLFEKHFCFSVFVIFSNHFKTILLIIVQINRGQGKGTAPSFFVLKTLLKGNYTKQ